MEYRGCVDGCQRLVCWWVGRNRSGGGAQRHTHQHECYGISMASRRRSSSNSKPASKKEKLYGQELGKIGRAAERGKAVNKVQAKMGEYSKQVMQNKKMRDMPVKRKVQEMGLQLGVAALTNPNTLRGVQSGVARGVNAVRNTGIPARASNAVRRRQIIVHGTPNEIKGNYLIPKAGSPASPTEPVVFGWNPTKKLGISAVNNPVPYTQGKGKVIVGSAPKSAVTSGDTEAILKSTKPVKVLGSVDPNKNFSQYDAELRKLLKRSGASINTKRPVAPKPSNKTKRF